ncbi:histidinol-phosphate transaminase [Nesterenkonia aerolata]|uniref:Histidinol-phosphate transaminase n=1 Tax=Nesterenkonia aerolata TaxID=3074079 RepID=A0ABU2DPG0_9MICC|nr:histidinol-phosphate transaminase [Nesterenkonia sp. LY-0111]MDR8018407.1 histidinol-phosphate transaminase [Nesterenkonia sp. LY-0111]
MTDQEPGLTRPIGATVTPRPAIAALPQYAAGRPPQPADGLTPYKLSSNENPYGPVDAARQAYRSVDALGRYPDPTAQTLRTTLAEVFDVPAEDIVTGTGSLGALTQLISCFAGTGPDGTVDEVIYPWRSFEAYPIVVRTAGAQDVQVLVDSEGRHDLEAMLAAITDRTTVILLCTPNNPTGPALSHQEVSDFLARVPRDIVVVIDEAYIEFIRAEGAVDALALYRHHPNVAVLRTFSKAHALASLRVGYVISQQEIIGPMRAAAPPFSVSAAAEAAAVASLGHLDEIQITVQNLVYERQRVREALLEAGWDVPAAEGNFVWLPLGEHSTDFAHQAGVLALSVRAFDGEGVRVSIGETEANDRLIELCRSYSLRG